MFFNCNNYGYNAYQINNEPTTKKASTTQTSHFGGFKKGFLSSKPKKAK